MPETRHLTLESDGDVWLRHVEDESDTGLLGSIEDPDNCPEGLEPEWAWLRQEWDDMCRFGEGCRATAEAAWDLAKGR